MNTGNNSKNLQDKKPPRIAMPLHGSPWRILSDFQARIFVKESNNIVAIGANSSLAAYMDILKIHYIERR